MSSFSRAGLVALVLAAAFWSLFAALLGWRILSPSDCARLPPGASQPQAGGLLIALLTSSRLRSNDLVIAVDGCSVPSWAQALTGFGQPPPWAGVGGGSSCSHKRHSAKCEADKLNESWPKSSMTTKIGTAGSFWRTVWRKAAFVACRAS